MQNHFPSFSSIQMCIRDRTTQVNELIERIKSLEELLVQKGIAIDKANRQNKALGTLVSGKKSERQEKNRCV